MNAEILSPEDARIAELEKALADLLKAHLGARYVSDPFDTVANARKALLGHRTEGQLRSEFGVIPR